MVSADSNCTDSWWPHWEPRILWQLPVPEFAYPLTDISDSTITYLLLCFYLCQYRFEKVQMIGGAEIPMLNFQILEVWRVFNYSKTAYLKILPGSVYAWYTQQMTEH